MDGSFDVGWHWRKAGADELITLVALRWLKGLLISEIAAGSPAEKAGLQTGTLPMAIKGESWLLGGDILVSVNGQEVRTPEQYLKAVKNWRSVAWWSSGSCATGRAE